MTSALSPRLPDTPQLPRAACITGMHRSGTSMVTSILSACGLWLGPPDRLMPARGDNQDGFFEHLDMVQLSDELLERFAGGWDALPAWPQSWVQGEVVRNLVPRAQKLVASLVASAGGHRLWGWKDPRACLTLPFWQTLVPDMKVVVCLRNPVAVARSLCKRGNSSLPFGVRLWEGYNRQLLETLSAPGYLVTHYDAWFVNPGAELKRVLDFLGLEPAAEILQAATAFIHEPYRHHQGGEMDLLASLGSLPAVALYDHLRSLAGPVYRASAEGRQYSLISMQAAADTPLGRLEQEVAFLRSRNQDLAKSINAMNRPSHLYRLGDTVDACVGGNGPLFLGEGWGVPHDAGTWSVGPKALIDLVVTRPVQGELRLLASVQPLVGGGMDAMSVTLLANGGVVKKFSLDASRFFTLDVALPPAFGGRVSLEFQIAEPRAPRDLGLSDDARLLGILLKDLRIEELAGSIPTD